MEFASWPSEGFCIGVVRLLSILRIIRLLRTVRITKQLRTIVVSLLSTFQSLLWTVVMLAMLVYTISLLLLQAIALNMDSIDELGIRAELDAHFGSIGMTMLSLFQVISGGVDWKHVLDALMQLSPWIAVPFTMYVIFCQFALMNVVTGVFVESAMISTSKERERLLLNTVRELFISADWQNIGMLTWETFQSKIDDPLMIAYFENIDLDVAEAEDLFKLLDMDESGTITLEEFVNGSLRLAGPAKAIDLAALNFELRHEMRRSALRQVHILEQLRQPRNASTASITAEQSVYASAMSMIPCDALTPSITAEETRHAPAMSIIPCVFDRETAALHL